MRISPFIPLLLFIFSGTLNALEWSARCESPQAEYLGKRYLDGLPAPEVAQSLRSQLGRRVWETNPVTVTLDSGETVQIQAGLNANRDMTVIQMNQRGIEIGSLSFFQKDSDLYISQSFTHPNFRSKGVSEALFGIMLSLENYPKTLRLGLADTNLRVIASQLSDKKVELMYTAEKVVADAIAQNRTRDIIRAIEHSPRGKVAARAGYKLSPDSIRLVSSESALDGNAFIAVSFRHEP